ncbi:MAG: hypothetical protein Q8M31_09275 [Beijerinckiaceae bacterium]|nr:hypothetical protein [Beijerinckiaceae bacterium]
MVATRVGVIHIMGSSADDRIAPGDPEAPVNAMKKLKAMEPVETHRRTQALVDFVHEHFTVSTMTPSILTACTKAVEASCSGEVDVRGCTQ